MRLMSLAPFEFLTVALKICFPRRCLKLLKKPRREQSRVMTAFSSTPSIQCVQYWAAAPTGPEVLM